MLDEFRSTLITWDKATSRIYSPVTANASDENGRKLVVQVVNSGQVEDLTGATLHLYWETRDKLHDGLDVFDAVDLKKGEFELSYTTGMLSNHGVLNANLVLIDTVGRVVSERFKITVTEGIDDDAIQSENSFSSLTQALIDISNLEQNYAPRLNDLTAQLQQTVEENVDVQRAVNYYWIPEAQPPARIDEIGWFMDAFSKNANEYINDHFEPLRNANTDYVTRESLGKDASGTYDVWRYIFTPKNYKKTILISTCLHGGEISSMVAMVRFLHYLVNEWEKYPALAYVRENVRIVYTPFVNPWGVSQKPRTRYNANGVDLNRNFPQGWESYVSASPAFGHDYKGVSAASEVETKYFMKNVSDFPDAIACFDFHNTGQTSRSFYSVIPLGYPYKELEQLADYFSAKWSLVNPISFFEQEGKPNACEYVWNTFGIPASHPEWCDMTTTGDRQHSGAEVTHSLAWFANVIIEHCRSFRPKVDFVSTTVTNRVTNASLSLDKSGWAGMGIGYTGVSDGVLSGTGTSSNYSPSFIGDLSKTDFLKGDLIYASVKATAPANCQKIELVLRDMTAGITGVVASISSPAAGVEQTLSGQYVFETTSSSPKIQIRYYFASEISVVNQPFSMSEPFVLALTTDLNVREIASGDLKFVLNQTGDFFVGTKQIDFIRNISSLDKSTLASTMFLLNKIKALS